MALSPFGLMSLQKGYIPLKKKTSSNQVKMQNLFQEKVSTLTINAEEKEEYIQVEETEEETLPSALILEKNQEIDHLSSEVQRLEQELESARDDKVHVRSHSIVEDLVAYF